MKIVCMPFPSFHGENFFDGHFPEFIFSRHLVQGDFIQKDCVPITQKCSVVYEFSSWCDFGYVICTTQRLGDRIEQHVPSNIRNKAVVDTVDVIVAKPFLPPTIVNPFIKP